MTDEISPTEEENRAIAAIARSDDGRLLHRYLRRVLETVIDLQDDCALRQQNGRRSLARDLMRLMAEGIDGRRTDGSADDPILTRPRGAVAVTGRARRDRSSLPRVDSYPDDHNPDGSSPGPS
jgi:hypothetical protein